MLNQSHMLQNVLRDDHLLFFSLSVQRKTWNASFATGWRESGLKTRHSDASESVAIHPVSVKMTDLCSKDYPKYPLPKPLTWPPSWDLGDIPPSSNCHWEAPLGARADGPRHLFSPGELILLLKNIRSWGKNNFINNPWLGMATIQPKKWWNWGWCMTLFYP
jgi:hypothetical protein